MTLELKQKGRLAIWMEVNLTVRYCLVHLYLAVHYHHCHPDAEGVDSIHRPHDVSWRVAIVLVVDLHCAAIQGHDQEHQFAEDVHTHIVRIVRGVDQDHHIPEVVVEVTHQEVDQAVAEAEVVVAIEFSVAQTFAFYTFFLFFFLTFFFLLSCSC